jgi:hypothetical protein
LKEKPKLEGARVLIVAGTYSGTEGVCLGAADARKWAISPDGTDAVLSLKFESEFGLLVDLSADPSAN